MLDPTGNIVNWNRGARRIKGYADEEIIGRHFSLFYTEEDRLNSVPQQALADGIKDRALRGRRLACSQRRHTFLGERDN